MREVEIEQLRRALQAGERRALARAITLAESRRPEHRAAARRLLELLGPSPAETLLIDSFGTMLVEEGHRVAVLAIDPSSARSGGSILGDKTRMPRLAASPRAFIRPSPAGSETGGVARRTREAIRLVEAAGFDIVIVETVGVGQSEVMVAEMTDVFVLLVAPGGGDELQGVKRGIMEIADLVVINKADGALREVAERTCAEYAAALRLMRRRRRDPEGYPRAMTASALEGRGIDAVWRAMSDLAEWRRESGWFSENRAAQRVRWMHRALEHGVIEALHAHPAVAARLPALERDVASGAMAPEDAAELLLALFLGEG